MIERCDFCHSQDTVTAFAIEPGVYDVSHFPGGVTLYNDDGEWAACAVCAALIRVGDRAGLTERTLRETGMGVEPGYREFVDELYSIFWSKFRGELQT